MFVYFMNVTQRFLKFLKGKFFLLFAGFARVHILIRVRKTLKTDPDLDPNYFSSNPQHWLFEKFDGVSPGP